jgi:hypothetical protein
VLGSLSNRTRTVDISKYLDIKRQAIEKFRSEIFIYVSNQKKPVVKVVDVARHLKKTEIFYK